LTRPEDIFFIQWEKVENFDVFLFRGYSPNPNHKWLTRPNPSHKKLTRPITTLHPAMPLDTFLEGIAVPESSKFFNPVLQ